MDLEFRNNKSQLVELVEQTVMTTKSVFKFDTQQFLTGMACCSIEMYTANDMPVSPLGNILPSTANLKSAYLTLYGQDPDNVRNEGYWIEQIPLVSLHRLQNGVDPFVRDLYTMVPRIIAWEKSTITIFGAALGNASAFSWVLNVGYIGEVKMLTRS